MQFPEYRGRRVRSKEGLRRLVRETRLSCDNLIYPLLSVQGSGKGSRLRQCQGSTGCRSMKP